MKPILKGVKEARTNAGAPKLQRVDTDNVAGDNGLWTSQFPELLDGVAPYDPNPNIPSISLGPNGFHIFISEDAVNNYILASMDHFDALSGLNCHYGLDAEWT
jgi:hypothetical protein